MGLLDKLKATSSKPWPDHSPTSEGAEELPKVPVRRTTRKPSLFPIDEGTRRSRADLLNMIADTDRPLELTDFFDDSESRLGLLCFNGIAVELRDLFRILEGLHQRAKMRVLLVEHISTFYEWFEGFYGIVSCIFDTEEDVLFSWLEKVGALTMENSLAPKRRKTKKERTKDLCWDILELKMQFEKKASGKVCLTDLVLEMKDEAEQLGSRILMYMQTLVDELPYLLNKNFGFDERTMIEGAVIGNFRASEPGLFVICAYSRGIVDAEKRSGFLEESFRIVKSSKSTVLKHERRFKKKHTDLADSLAVKELRLVRTGTD